MESFHLLVRARDDLVLASLYSSSRTIVLFLSEMVKDALGGAGDGGIMQNPRKLLPEVDLLSNSQPHQLRMYQHLVRRFQPKGDAIKGQSALSPLLLDHEGFKMIPCTPHQYSDHAFSTGCTAFEDHCLTRGPETEGAFREKRGFWLKSPTEKPRKAEHYEGV